MQLRKRLQGAPSNNRSEDLTATAKVSLDYYTQEEMVQFKKPKKKKSSMRRKEKLNLDALEAEAVAAGLGVGDLGSRNDRKRQAIREEEERSEAERKKNAYQSAFAKAEEASKSLRMQLDTVKEDDEENTIVDDEDLYKSLERARKLALKKQNEQRVSGPEAVARLAATVLSTQAADNGTSGEQQEDKIIITEMEEFVGGLQLDEGKIIMILLSWNLL